MRLEDAQSLLIVPEAELDLGCRLDGLVSASKSDILCCRLDDGTVLVLDSSLSTVSQFRLDQNTRLKTVSPDGKHLVTGNSEEFQVRNNYGSVLYEESTVLRFDDFQFSAEGNWLWIIRHVDADWVRLECRSTRTWQPERFTMIEEPCSATNFYLNLHPESIILSVSAAAGQDGSWLYWAYDDGTMIHVRQTSLFEDGFPGFHPTGSEFVTEKDGYLNRYRFPKCEELNSFGTDVDLDEDHNISQAHYVSDTYIMFLTNAGRLYLTTLNPFKMTHELSIKGHEPERTPKSIRWNDDVYYEADLYADFDEITVHGDKFVCVHRQDLWDFRNTNHTISIWSKPTICGPSSIPDPSAPLTAEFVKQL